MFKIEAFINFDVGWHNDLNTLIVKKVKAKSNNITPNNRLISAIVFFKICFIFLSFFSCYTNLLCILDANVKTNKMHL